MDFLVLLLFVIFVSKIKLTKELNKEYLSLDSCLAWRGFFALVVVFHHLAQETTDGIFFRSFSNVGFLAVSVFFFFSGYGLQKRYISDAAYQKGFLNNRIPTVLFPYIIMTVIYWAMYALCGDIYSVKDIFASIINGHPIVRYSWYVITILLFYVAFYFLMKIARGNSKRMIIWSFFAYFLWVGLCFFSGFGAWWYFSAQVLIVGMIWASFEGSIINFIKPRLIPISILITLLFFSLFLLVCNITRFTSSFLIDVLLKFFLSVLFVLFILVFSMKFRTGNCILKFFGKLSFEIYLSQGLFITLFRSSVLSIENDFLYSTAVLTSTVIFSLLIHKLCGFVLSQYRRISA